MIFACVIVLAAGAATVTEGAEPYPLPSDESAILVTLSTPPNDSPEVIPKIFASICGAAPAKFTGGLVTVQDEPLFVDSPNASVIVNAFVDVPETVCALLPVPVMSINAPPSVADNVNAFALTTVLTKKVVSSVRPAIAVPPFAF